MVNSQTGEMTVELDGQTYTLALTLTAMAVLEDLFKMTFDEVTSKANAGSMTHLRAFFWVMLNKHHKGLSIEEAGDLVTLGKLSEIVSSALAQIVTSSAPDKNDVSEVVGKGKKENPTKARTRAAGTGASSISRLEASA